MTDGSVYCDMALVALTVSCWRSRTASLRARVPFLVPRPRPVVTPISRADAPGEAPKSPPGNLGAASCTDEQRAWNTAVIPPAKRPRVIFRTRQQGAADLAFRRRTDTQSLSILPLWTAFCNGHGVLFVHHPGIVGENPLHLRTRADTILL